MSEYAKATLIDDIRNDALKLMEIRGIPYEEAYKISQRNLISGLKITEFVPTPLSVEVGDIVPSKVTKESSSKTLNEIIYNTLNDIINVSEYSPEQLEEYYVARKMNVDISKFAKPEWNPVQVRFLSIMLASDMDISSYVNDTNFDAEKAFADIYANEIVKEKEKVASNN